MKRFICFFLLFAVLLFIPIVTILYVFFPVTVRTFCMVK